MDRKKKVEMEPHGDIHFSNEESNVNWTTLQPRPFRNVLHKKYNRANEKSRVTTLNLPSLYTYNNALRAPSGTAQSKIPAGTSVGNSVVDVPISGNREMQTMPFYVPMQPPVVGNFTTRAQPNARRGLLGSNPMASYKFAAPARRPNAQTGLLGSYPEELAYQALQGVKPRPIHAPQSYVSMQQQMVGNQKDPVLRNARVGFPGSSSKGLRGYEAPRAAKQRPIGNSVNYKDKSSKGKLNAEILEDDFGTGYKFPAHLINMEDYE